ncbi:MAG: GldM family protein, partial [Bacteroidota bacterium]
LQPSASGGGISLRPAGGPGKYIATATTITPKGQEAVINVSAKTKDGVKPQGSQKFRIRRLPDPIGALDSYENGSSIPKAALRAASKLFAKKPTGFDLNANYSVTKWSLTVLNKDKALSASGNGTVLSAEAQGHLAKAQSGARIAIELTAVAPDKSMRPVS